MRAVPVLVAVLALTACSGGRVTQASAPGAPTASVTTAGPAAPTAAAPTTAPAYGWYLSLGDSLAFGYQEKRFQDQKAAGTPDPAAYDTGFSDVVTAALKKRSPGLVAQNTGCAAETTTTYSHGGCPAQPELLHVPYTGPQADAVQTFLRGRTGPGLVTVALGSNDGLEVLDQCPDSSAGCILPKLPAALGAMRANLTADLAAVTAAAPAATVLVMLDYNPFVNIDPAAGLAVGLLDSAIAAAAKDAGVKTVDARAVFNTGDEKTLVCSLTGICTGYQDIHPTDEGYARLAALFLTAAGIPV